MFEGFLCLKTILLTPLKTFLQQVSCIFNIIVWVLTGHQPQQVCKVLLRKLDVFSN